MLSSIEAEYRALRKVVAELSWLKHLLADLGFSISYPILVYCDSQDAIHIAKNLVFHKWTKHIDVDYHFVCDCLSDGLISLHFICSTDQLADILTKSLSGVLHHQILSKLSVFPFSTLRGVLTWVLGH